MKKAMYLPLLFLLSCKSTESINRFARSAAAGTRELHAATPGFGDFCRLYSENALRTQTDTSVLASVPHKRVICKEYKATDSLVRVIELGLYQYFSLIQAASDKKLLAYNARDLVAGLDGLKDQWLPSLALTDEKVGAIKGLLNTVINEPLKLYRDKKLKQVIRQADPALDIVTGAYIFILDSALSGEADQAEANYKSFVYLPLYSRARTPVEKALINNRYTEFLETMAAQRLTIRKSSRLLETLRKDHHLLATARDKPTFREAETTLGQDIVLIQELIEEIIVLTR